MISMINVERTSVIAPALLYYMPSMALSVRYGLNKN